MENKHESNDIGVVTDSIKLEPNSIWTIFDNYKERMDQLEKRIEVLDNNQKVLISKTLSRG